MPPRELTADEAQRIFRILLDALAHPGRLGRLPEPMLRRSLAILERAYDDLTPVLGKGSRPRKN